MLLMWWIWPYEQRLYARPEVLQLYRRMPTLLRFLGLMITGGEVGHLSRDCPSEPSSERVCYKVRLTEQHFRFTACTKISQCKQPGHVQAACPN